MKKISEQKAKEILEELNFVLEMLLSVGVPIKSDLSRKNEKCNKTGKLIQIDF